MTSTFPKMPTTAFQRWEQEYKRQQAVFHNASRLQRTVLAWQEAFDSATSLSRFAEEQAARLNRIANPPHLETLKRNEEMVARWLEPAKAAQTAWMRQDEARRRALSASKIVMPKVVTDTWTAQIVSQQMLKFESLSGVKFADSVREPVLQAATTVNTADVEVVNPIAALMEEQNELLLLGLRMQMMTLGKADLDLTAILTIILVVISVLSLAVSGATLYLDAAK